MSTLLETDLVVRRGGAKHRLIARCYAAIQRLSSCPPDFMEYPAFRKLHEKKTFAKLHELYDAILPAEFRA